LKLNQGVPLSGGRGDQNVMPATTNEATAAVTWTTAWPALINEQEAAWSKRSKGAADVDGDCDVAARGANLMRAQLPQPMSPRRVARLGGISPVGL